MLLVKGRLRLDGLEGMRSVVRGSLARSLRTLEEPDRLSAAWTVACGRAMAERGEVVGFAEGVLSVQVTDRAWLDQMLSMRGRLAAEISRIAGVGVREIHFEGRGATARRVRSEATRNRGSERT